MWGEQGGVMTAGKLSPETLLTATTLHWDTQGFSYLGYPSTLKSWYKINVKQGFWSNKQCEPGIELSYLYYPILCTVSLCSDTDHSEDWGHSSSDSQSQGVKELHPAVCHTLITAELLVTLLLQLSVTLPWHRDYPHHGSKAEGGQDQGVHVPQCASIPHLHRPGPKVRTMIMVTK